MILIKSMIPQIKNWVYNYKELTISKKILKAHSIFLYQHMLFLIIKMKCKRKYKVKMKSRNVIFWRTKNQNKKKYTNRKLMAIIMRRIIVANRVRKIEIQNKTIRLK